MQSPHKNGNLLVKLSALKAGLPGKVVSFYIVPLAPFLKDGLVGHTPVKVLQDFLVRKVPEVGISSICTGQVPRHGVEAPRNLECPLYY